MIQDHQAAMALVSSHKALSDTQQSSSSQGLKDTNTSSSEKKRSEKEEDTDLQRALDLVDLHYSVKMKHVQGQDMGLKEARAEVDRVLQGR